MPSDSSNRGSEGRSREDLFQHQQFQRGVPHIAGSRLSNGATPPNHSENPYRRTQNIQRSKSLTRPERHRPRQGMLSGTHRQDATSSAIPQATHRRPHNQPMSHNLQAQLEKHKQQHQQHAVPAEAVKSKLSDSVEQDEEEEEKEPKVLTSWWSWCAFLCTCCFPSFIIRAWFGKSNKSMQQAWREKVRERERS
jgi:chitin synthase